MTNKEIVPEAFFDSLSIAHKLDNVLDGFTFEEIHLFAYFASIIFFNLGNNINEWGYRFILNRESCYPFSEELSFVLARHESNGFLEKKNNYYSITARGVDEFNIFRKQKYFELREPLISGACTVNILMPFSANREALLNDSEIKKAKTLNDKRTLEPPYKELKEVLEALNISTDDPILHGVTWITYITELNNVGIVDDA